MTIKASSYPTSRPTLDLNFAQTKRLDPRVTFTRSSTGTYFDANGVLQSAATNTARFDHNPATGESLGLLVEEARTNLATYSEQFSTWSGSASTEVNQNVELAPDGTISADKHIPAASSAQHYIERNVTTTAAAHTLSICAKASGYNFVELTAWGTVWNGNVLFNISTGSFVSGSNYSSTSVQALPNGWYRVSVTFTASAATNVLRIRAVDSSGTSSGSNFTGNGTSGVLLWGAQLEAGSFPTSYIPTPATFTSRASSATYYDASGVIQAAGTNVARSAAFFPDSNGVMRPAGLLLEAAGTNLLLRSQEIDNVATWAGSYKLNYSANATTAPDGTATADKVIPNTENVSHSTFQDPAGTISGTYTFSLYAKASGYNKIVLFIDGASAGGLFGSGSAVFDLSTKAITNINGSAAIETLPNGWYRCSVTGTSGSAVTVSTGFSIYDNSGNSTFAGNGTDGIFIWGAQLEASPYATSYIATTTATVTRSADVSSSATVTRSADVASITGTNFSGWYNQSEGTLFANALSRGSTGANFLAALNLTSAGGSTFADVLEQSTSIRLSVFNNPTTIYSVTPSTSGVVAGSTRKAALALKSGNYGAALNGSASASGASASVPPSFDRLLIMNYPGFGTANGTISRLTYWPTRLSDATLQAITQ